MVKLRCAIVFAKDLPRLVAFYRDAFGLRVTTDSPMWVELDAGGAALGVHAIPKPIADQIVVTSPPKRREDTPIKLVFEVPDLDAAVAELAGRGAVMDAPNAWGSCDGLDPEGNVFQIARRA